MKKLIERTNLSSKSILESYKQNKENPSGPIIGTFKAKGIIKENTISQNRTYYPTEAWAQKSALGIGGDYIDEKGKLRPSTLFGSLDHPADGHAEFYLSESAIAWRNLEKQPDNTWDGEADILNTVPGRILNTVLEYAKTVGGGDLLGVSTRSLGDTALTESADGQYEQIIPDNFKLMTIDFVYNPSFTNKASLTESKKAKKESKILFESIRNLGEEDKDNAKLYAEVAEKLEEEAGIKVAVKKQYIVESKTVEAAKADYIKQLKDTENQLHNALYELGQMTEEDWTKANYDGTLEAAKAKVQKEYDEIVAEIANVENPQPVPVVESKDLDKALEGLIGTEDEDPNKPDDADPKEPEEDPNKPEDKPNEPEEDPLEDHVEDDKQSFEQLAEQITQLKEMIQTMLDVIMPVEAPEEDAIIDETEPTDEEPNPEDLDEPEEEFELTEEEAAAMSEEELEYLLNNNSK